MFDLSKINSVTVVQHISEHHCLLDNLCILGIRNLRQDVWIKLEVLGLLSGSAKQVVCVTYATGRNPLVRNWKFHTKLEDIFFNCWK